MTLNDAYKKYLTPDRLPIFFAKNELYYQISLGNYIYQTTLDLDEALEKINELNLHIETNVAYKIFKEILEKFYQEEDFEENIDEYIKISACYQSLEDFITYDKELLNSEWFIKSTSLLIEENRFFTEKMKQQFEEQLDETIVKWKSLVGFVI